MGEYMDEFETRSLLKLLSDDLEESKKEAVEMTKRILLTDQGQEKIKQCLEKLHEEYGDERFGFVMFEEILTEAYLEAKKERTKLE